MSNTPCKECIFAQYDLTGEAPTQTGCNKGMLDKYRKAGTNIIEAYDTDKEFFVLEGRICPFFRDYNWASRIENDENFDETVERMLKFETSLSFHIMIFMQDSIDDVKKTLESINKQDKMPVQVTIIRPRNSIVKPKEVTELFVDSKYRWRAKEFVCLQM